MNTGSVKIRSRIVEHPVEETLRLREEKVTVNRQAVERPASKNDLENFQEGKITMTEHTEVPEIAKNTHVVEEVTVAKDVNDRKK